MRIVHYLPTIRLADGGVVRAVLDLCAAFAAAGHDATLLCCDDADAPDAWRAGAPGLPRLHALGSPALVGGLLSRSQRSSAASIVEQADVLHLHTPWIPSNRQIARLARRAQAPYVVSLHGMLDDWSMARRRLKKQIYLLAGGRRLLARAACLHCTAEGERDQSRPRLPPAPVEVIPLIPDAATLGRLVGPDLARRTLLGGEATAMILFLGRIFEGKGVEQLIDAAALIAEAGTPFVLALAGPGDATYLATLRRHAERAGVADRIRWLGFVTGDLKQSLLEAADVFVSLSSHENFGFTIVEALACRTPAIITKGVAIWRTLDESGGVRVVATTDEAAEAIRSFLADPAIRLELGDRARRHVLSWLAPDRIRRQYEVMYEQARARAAAGGAA